MSKMKLQQSGETDKQYRARMYRNIRARRTRRCKRAWIESLREKYGTTS